MDTPIVKRRQGISALRGGKVGGTFQKGLNLESPPEITKAL
jgi:hypothetical protein